MGRGFRRWDARQIDLEGSSSADFAGDPNVSAALLDDAVDGGEAKAGSLRSLSRKKRLKDVRLSLSVHACAGVADLEHNVIAGPQRCVMPCVLFTEGYVGSLNRELPAGGHGIPGVHGEIHDDLFDLTRVSADCPEVSSRQHHEVDIFPDHAREHL